MDGNQFTWRKLSCRPIIDTPLDPVAWRRTRGLFPVGRSATRPP